MNESTPRPIDRDIYEGGNPPSIGADTEVVHPSPDLTPTLEALVQLAPHEIGPLIERVYDDAQTAHDKPAVQQLVSDVSAAIEHLPEYDLLFARAAYTALAESPLENSREFATYLVHRLTRQDKELGLRLWDQLVRDPSKGVRSDAIEEIQDLLGPNEDCTNGEDAVDSAELAERGLTEADAQKLVNAWRAAEAGERIHDIGNTVLSRLIEIMQLGGEQAK